MYQLNQFLLEYREFIVALHVFATTLGLGGAIVTDYMFMRFLKDYRVSAEEKDVLDNLSKVIWSGAALLVLTGFLLAWPYGSALLDTPSFLIKMTGVAVILVNGIFLNYYVSPKLTSMVFNDPGANMPAVNTARRLSPLFGGISITSWLFVFFMGAVGQQIDFSYPMFLGAYAALLIVGIAGAFIVTTYKFKPRKDIQQ